MQLELLLWALWLEVVSWALTSERPFRCGRPHIGTYCPDTDVLGDRTCTRRQMWCSVGDHAISTSKS